MANDQEFNRRGRAAALVIAGTGLGWILANVLGGWLDWSQRTRAFFDLAALGGFVWAMWMVYGLWRLRQEHKD